MSDAICRTLGLGTSASERAACRLLEQRGSEPAGYISDSEARELDGILRNATPELRPRIANALLNGLSRPGGAQGRVSAGGGVEPMLRAHATAASRPAANAPSEYEQLMEYGMNAHKQVAVNKVVGGGVAMVGGGAAAVSGMGIAAIAAGVVTAPAWVPVALVGTAVVGTGAAIWGAGRYMGIW